MTQSSTHHQCIIIGAGLSGLTTAVRLQAAGIRALILEARDRIGGRILTERVANGAFDLGPAWWWGHHTHVQKLMRELDVAGFTQFEQGIAVYDTGVDQAPQHFRQPPMAVSYRFDGGVGALIERLAQRLPDGAIKLNSAVSQIVLRDSYVDVLTEQGAYSADRVICTLPPKLAVDSLAFDPPLPSDISQAMDSTMTWMGQAMKVTLTYDTAFWRARGLSGLTVSHVGPVAQFHDHSSADGSSAALFGWVGDHSPARQLTPDARRDAIIAQAVRLFGEQAARPIHYAECNWANEPFTTHPDREIEAATEHPQYGHPLLQTPQFGGRLHWASTEASPVNGGYLDGAIYIGERTAERIQHSLANA